MAAFSDSDDSVSKSIRQHIFKLCSEFLSSAWSNPENITIQRLTGGRSNRIYRCKTSARDSANEVIFRFYGSDFLEGTEESKRSRTKETLISYIISEKRLGPHLIGIFDGGRIEEYIQSTIPTREQYEGQLMFKALAYKLATIHSLRLPFSHRVQLDLTAMVSGLTKSTALAAYLNGSKVNAFSEKLLNFNYAEELDLLIPLFTQIPSKIVFCHQDLNRLNILIRTRNSDDSYRGQSSSTLKEAASKIMLIDYECAGYSYRWADFVTFFSEICSNRWQEKKQFSFSDYPGPDRRTYFIKHYLSTLNELQLLEMADLDAEFSKLMKEIDFGGMILNLVNALWRLNHPKIDSDSMLFLWEEANFRLDLYLGLKEYFLNNYNNY
ncbi:choline/ethanolamine kinase [Tetranychus urticae]|uniref:Aminoglycoside phosphotransferase domain-containing protein n=1 Tax=Tetranychus urticae TaxID=32264 RepID=T1K966_TETUR|nr:choline/ethanolamine kinase [Tetranychus urticae]